MLEELAERLSRVRTRDDLTGEVIRLRDVLDTEHLVYHSIRPGAEQYAALTYSPQWVRHYVDEGYDRIDPVVRAAIASHAPVDWRRLDWTGRGARAFLGEALDAGVGHQGMSLPIRGPGGQFAVVSVSSRAEDAAWDRWGDAYRSALILAGHFLNQTALMLDRVPDEVRPVSLSPRETDSLTMIALGLNRAQAAEKLSISEHTLRVYIESARFKLSARNTTHAVARALAEGLLSI